MPEPRRNIRLAIYIGLDEHKLMTNYTVNVSTGGVFIEADDILPVDTLLEIKFKLPDDDIIITCNVWFMPQQFINFKPLMIALKGL